MEHALTEETKDVPAWELRFRAAVMTFPRWAREAPERLTVVTNESGAYQVYAWDRARGTRRQVTDHPIGVIDAVPTPDGEGVVWFHDETGSEVGRWVIEAFHGDRRERRALVEGVPDAWSVGLAIGDGVTVVGTATEEDGFTIWRARGGGEAEPSTRTPRCCTWPAFRATAASWPSSTPNTATTSTWRSA